MSTQASELGHTLLFVGAGQETSRLGWDLVLSLVLRANSYLGWGWRCHPSVWLDFHSKSWGGMQTCLSPQVQLITSLPLPQGAQGRRPPPPMQPTQPSGY